MDNVVRISVDLITGFPDKAALYEYKFDNEPCQRISPFTIHPPGLVPFELDRQNTTIEYFVDQYLTWFRDGVITGLNKSVLVG